MQRSIHTREEDYRAEFLRLRGGVWLAASAANHAAAEQCFVESLAMARQQQASIWALRTAMSLGRLWQSQHKAATARRLVAGSYDWFPQSFAIPALRAARVLLEEVS